MSEKPEIPAEAVVTRPVSDVLQEQTDLLRQIDHKVDQKADKSDLVAVMNKVEGHGDRIRDLEGWRASNTRLWSGVGVGVLAMSGIIGGLLGGHII